MSRSSLGYGQLLISFKHSDKRAVLFSANTLGSVICNKGGDLIMSELTDTSTLVHHRHRSWVTKFGENRAAFVWLFICFVMGALCSLLGGILGPIIDLTIGGPFAFPICFVAGLLFALSVLFGARFFDRCLFGSVKASVLALEDRLIEGVSHTPREDIEKLITGLLKLKRLAAADLYSQRLLAITMSCPDGLMKRSDWVVTTECWASTDKYHKGWKYKLVWLYETRGVLTLSPDSLDFQSKKFTLRFHPSMITKIEVKRHPLWLKPIPLKFISITIQEHDFQHVVNITPSFGQTDTVWDCNCYVDIWMKRLNKARRGIQLF